MLHYQFKKYSRHQALSRIGIPKLIHGTLNTFNWTFWKPYTVMIATIATKYLLLECNATIQFRTITVIVMEKDILYLSSQNNAIHAAGEK